LADKKKQQAFGGGQGSQQSNRQAQASGNAYNTTISANNSNHSALESKLGSAASNNVSMQISGMSG